MKISNVESLTGRLSRFFPVQSVRQFLSYVLFTLIGILLFLFFVSLSVHGAAFPIILLGAFAGSSVILSMTLPARFRIDFESPWEKEKALSEVKQRLRSFGYRNMTTRSESEIEFSTTWPRPLVWDENRVKIAACEKGLVLSGPIFVIRLMHGGMSKPQDGKSPC